MKKIFLLATIFCLPLFAFAQRSQPDTMWATKISSQIKLDGVLNEEVWSKAKFITNFTQRELVEGAAPTERTEVAVVYDERAVYFGVRCYDSEPDKLIRNQMRRDFEWWTQDNFQFAIDSYNDKRNGYLFVTNPNGARADALINDNGNYFNTDWNGVWDVAANVTSEGWFLEFEIPFSTLKFRSEDVQFWGINFERNIRRKREQLMWQSWGRDGVIDQVSRAGTLAGIAGITSRNFIELKPYGTAGVESPNGKPDYITKLGGDLNYLITPNLKLNFTVNTDFAQVEVDQAQINFSRFPLFFPEKREFFLEGRDFFDFGLGNTVGFYSRRIGLTESGETVPIIAGARLLGKEGNTTIGAISMQTAEKGAIPSGNHSVLSWRQDILGSSTVGLMGTSKIEPGRQNFVYGGNFRYFTPNFLENKNLTFGGALAQSYTSDRTEKLGDVERIFVSYPNDQLNIGSSWERVADEFNPELGFAGRKNYQRFGATIEWKPRLVDLVPWVQQFRFRPVNANYYINDETGQTESFFNELNLIGFTTQSGDFFDVFVYTNNDRPQENFRLLGRIDIPEGNYWFHRYQVQAGTFAGRDLSAFALYQWGDFYNGKQNIFLTNGSWRPSRFVGFWWEFRRNQGFLPGGDFLTHQILNRVEFAITPKLFGAVFTQWNDFDKRIFFNFRLNWIPVIGTDFFLVFNQGYDTADPRWRSTTTAAVTKLIWRFVL